MRDLAGGDAGEVLERIVSESATAAMHCLAAAEQAVQDGRFNIAKVLRACAHSARRTSLDAARMLAAKTRPADVLARSLALLERQAADADALQSALIDQHATDSMRASPPEVLASAVLEGVLRRALRSLERNRDVLESDVAQSLWGCQICGAIAEGEQPESCSRCGALGFEFEWFGPFYSGTSDRLGRLAPAEIVDLLQRSPERLVQLLEGIDEDRLMQRPSPDEWCMKEIAGHLIDTTEAFIWRVRTIRAAATPPPAGGSTPPWRLLEGKGYPELSPAVIVDGMRKATNEALSLVDGIGVADWSRGGLIAGRVTTVLDLGAWLANHNVAHFAQIEALRGATP